MVKKQAQAMRQKNYESSPITQTAAENLVNLMHDKKVDRADRDIRVSELRCNIEVKFVLDRFGGTVRADYDSFFDFSKDNLQLPEDKTAFICAVCSLAIEMYKARYPRDKSGTSYSITFKIVGHPSECSIEYTALTDSTYPQKAGDPLNCGIADLSAPLKGASERRLPF